MPQYQEDTLSLVRDTARKFLSERCSIAEIRHHLDAPSELANEIWKDVAALGWTTILAPEPAEDEPAVAAGIVTALAEELGRALFPGPVLSTAIVARAIAHGSAEAVRERYLNELGSGAASAAYAAGPAAGRASLSADRTADGFLLTGTLWPVLNGADVDLTLVRASIAKGDIDLLVPTGLPGISVRRLATLDLTRPAAALDFDHVVVPSEYRLDLARDDATGELATIGLCAETIGAAHRTLQFTLEYAKARVAFGRPIGAFQALKHRFANMLLAIENARAAVDASVIGLAAGPDAARGAASVAKYVVARQLPAVVRDCLQIHGGIGFTWEHDIHLFLRRVESNAVMWGDADFHAGVLARDLGLRPCDAEGEVVR